MRVDRNSQLSILLIGDDSPHMDDLSRLLSADLTVVVYHPISAIDDLTYDEIAGFECIILCPGNFFPHFDFDIQECLCRFVNAGGFILAMPFTAWTVSNRGNYLLDDILPVSGETFFESCLVKWESVSDTFKKKYAKLPNSRRLEADEAVISGEFLRCKSEARALITSEVSLDSKTVDTPLVSIIQVGRGRSIYFNASYHSHKSGDIPIWRGNYANPIGPYSSLIVLFREIVWGISPVHFYYHDYLHKLDSYKLFPYLLHLPHTSADISLSHSHAPVDIEISEKNIDHIRIFALDEHTYTDEHTYRSMSQSEKISVCRASIEMLHRVNMASTKESERATSPNERGRFLEQFVKRFLQLQPGIEVIKERGRRGNLEIDLLIRNESQHPFWRSLGSPIAVECKNYRRKIGSDHIRDFSGKMRQLAIKTGFFISLEGVTGNKDNAARRTIREEHKNGQVIIPLDRHDITDALKELTPTRVIRRCYESLFL